MGKLFGTDGIRGIAGAHPVTEEIGRRLGRAIVEFSLRRGLSKAVVIGRDTRASGEGLAQAVVSGVRAAGGDACLAGVLPTPGVAFLTRTLEAGAGVVISASHNPHEYNGFKIFSHRGFKLNLDEEAEIEDGVRSDKDDAPGMPEGRVTILEDAGHRYADYVVKTLPEGADLQGMHVVIDCANGAVSGVAPGILGRMGVGTHVLSAEPDGRNINLDCGSEHTAPLEGQVLEKAAHAGLAFDGDGDRLVAVDEKGKKLTGDQVMTILAKGLTERGAMSNPIVVSTVMSNLGFRLALKALDLRHVATQVGDRHVVEEMVRRGARLGGEDSGHIIFLDHHTTGDGLISALQLLYTMKTLGLHLSELSGLMTVYPQVLVNVPVTSKPEIHRVPEVAGVIKEAERALGQKGRVLVRFSGTEPVCRVMVEGEERSEITAHAQRIAETIRKTLNP